MTWNKNKPAGSDPLNISDDLIRQNWAALEDALARDHNFPGTEGSDAGEHEKVTLREQTEKPSVDSGKSVLYAKSDGIYIEKSDGTEIKLFDFSIEKLTNTDNADNADKVDGFDASQTRTPNTIPVADADGWINDWIKQGEGSGLDADTVRGSTVEFQYNFSDNGYIIFPNGFIIQWGHDQINENSNKTINFNISFPNLCCGVFITAINASGQGGGEEDYWGLTALADTNAFTIVNQYDSGQQFYWVAIGY